MSGDATPEIELKGLLQQLTEKSHLKTPERPDSTTEPSPRSKLIISKTTSGEANVIKDPEGESTEEITMYGETMFTQKEGEKLMITITSIMASSDQPSQEMDFKTFQKVMMNTLKLSQYFLTERVFEVFDRDNDGKISPDEYIYGLSTILRGSLEDQIIFAYKVYDANEKGFLTLEDVSICLNESSQLSGFRDRKLLVGKYSEINKNLGELIFPKLDTDKDGKISFEDFHSACLKDPTLVETLGPCLPKDCICPLTKQKIRNDISNQARNLEYLTKTSIMTRICTPVTTKVNRYLTAIEVVRNIMK